MASLARTFVLAGTLTLLSVVVPHDTTRYDPQFVVIGAVFVVGGVALRRVRRASVLGVHLACAAASAGVLALTWFSMADLGGVQVAFLLLVLMAHASIGSLVGPVALLAAQSGGYALVLATADPSLGLDRVSQWVVTTMGLVVALMYQRRVRSQVLAVEAYDRRVRAERATEQLQYEQRLFRVDERLRATDELQRGFVAMASHELRTPLTAIGGFSRTMLDRWEQLDDHDKHHFVAVIDDQAERLTRLVTDLLLVSQIEAGRIRSEAGSLDVATVIAQVLREIGAEADIAVTCPVDAVAHADGTHLAHSLRNLLTNARVHGAPPMSVAVERDDAGIVIRVRDSGGGVPEELLPTLFRRFAQGPRPEGVQHPGSTGLGLSIVHGLVHADGGDVWYEPGGDGSGAPGATFCVRLPAATAVAAEP
ncbi:MAG: hypothetical protein JWM98_3147 [Thermoleophilia bacterium]|nr:hypothetical protein [Thermoleophilia bacterium]